LIDGFIEGFVSHSESINNALPFFPVFVIGDVIKFPFSIIQFLFDLPEFWFSSFKINSGTFNKISKVFEIGEGNEFSTCGGKVIILCLSQKGICNSFLCCIPSISQALGIALGSGQFVLESCIVLVISKKCLDSINFILVSL